MTGPFSRTASLVAVVTSIITSPIYSAYAQTPKEQGAGAQEAAAPWAPDAQEIEKDFNAVKKQALKLRNSARQPEKKANLSYAQSLQPASCSEIKTDDKITSYNCPNPNKVALRLWVPLTAIHNDLINTVIFLEDAKFWTHRGIDTSEMMKALEEDIKSGELKRGGSTITQQLAKNLFFTKEKSIIRKLRELEKAVQLEKRLTKKQILELYLNVIEWGPGIYGVEAASRVYFDRTAAQLSTEQAWLLALMIPNPKELCLWFKPRAEKSIVNRAQTLASRLKQEHILEASVSNQTLSNFMEFIQRWKTAKPPSSGYTEGRTFPAVWGPAL